MSKIVNRAAAKDWQEEEERKTRIAEYTERELELLQYAACKRKTGYPSIHTMRACGLTEAASLLEQAYNLLGDAYSKALEEVEKLRMNT